MAPTERSPCDLQEDHPASPLHAPSKVVSQVLQSEGIDPLRESLDTFAALEGGSGGLLDFEAAAAVPEKDLKKYLQASQLNGNLLAGYRQVCKLLLGPLSMNARLSSQPAVSEMKSYIHW